VHDGVDKAIHGFVDLLPYIRRTLSLGGLNAMG
jgi:hypothetical protein